MTLMQHEIKGVKNYYVSCITIDNKITMQYKVIYHKKFMIGTAWKCGEILWIISG
jgi:hypothetical protein